MKRALLSFALGLAACAGPSRPARLADSALRPSTGAARDAHLRDVVAASRLTVLVFFSASCPCQRIHDGRLIELSRRYASSGVAFVLVDSEVGATRERDAREAEQRGYPFPLYLDPDARLARAAGAEFATYSLVVDGTGRVLYRGGIDSDRNKASANARPYLSDAIDAILAGRPAEAQDHPALGCALRTE